MLPIELTETYGYLREEVSAIIHETAFRIESEKLKSKWLVGKSIIDFHSDRRYGDAVIKRLSSDLSVGERDLYYCVKFADKFPHLLDQYNEIDVGVIEVDGKTPTWTKIKQDLLVEKKCEHPEIKSKIVEVEICTSCGKCISRKEKKNN
jgi:hypothetical protein